MEDLENKVDKLDNAVVDLQVTLAAHQMMIKCLLQYIGFKHGNSDRDAILNGILDGMKQSTVSANSYVDAESAQLLTEKLRQFI